MASSACKTTISTQPFVLRFLHCPKCGKKTLKPNYTHPDTTKRWKKSKCYTSALFNSIVHNNILTAADTSIPYRFIVWQLHISQQPHHSRSVWSCGNHSKRQPYKQTNNFLKTSHMTRTSGISTPHTAYLCS